MLGLGYYGVRLFAKVVSVPVSILYPMIAAIALIGSYAVRNSFFDVGACFVFGAIGWLFKRYGFPVARSCWVSFWAACWRRISGAPS